MLSTASFPTAQSSATQLVQQFKLLKSLKFPKHKFGKKGEERVIICMCIIIDSQNIHCMIIITTLRFNLRASNFKFWGMPLDRLESSMLCMPILENHGS